MSDVSATATSAGSAGQALRGFPNGDGSDLVVVGGRWGDRIIHWGESLDLRDTLENFGTDSIPIPPASFLLRDSGRISLWGGAAGTGRSVLVKATPVLEALRDRDSKMREGAIEALTATREVPLGLIERAFRQSTGKTAQRLIDLMHQRDDPGLAAALGPNFSWRSHPEQLRILTAIAGHTNADAFALIALGLKDGDASVQRAALMRLLEYPADKAAPLIDDNAPNLAPELRPIAASVRSELETRIVFPFLANAPRPPQERTFPSVEGTGPMVSPDGEWVAYVETGTGRSIAWTSLDRDRRSIVHAVDSQGRDDRVISDLFLRGWMSDSKRIGSSRDSVAEVAQLAGQPAAEFGQPVRYDPSQELFEDTMPHCKAFVYSDSDISLDSMPFDQNAAFSPDGKWFGPHRVRGRWRFFDTEGHHADVEEPFWLDETKTAWSPDGRYVLILPGDEIYFPNGKPRPSQAVVIDFKRRRLVARIKMDVLPSLCEWRMRQGGYNPWSRDGKLLAFIRGGQVWIAGPRGQNARQLTFDSSNKIFPAFSPDGSKVAYITWQTARSGLRERVGPTDVWVVDCETSLAARVTRSRPGLIEGLDWLNPDSLIFDRVHWDEMRSSLKTLSFD